MKIYKFKDLTKQSTHSHIFQILNENRVWCASPGSLNDDAEFSFELDYSPSGETAKLLMQVIEKFGNSKFPSHLTASYAVLSNRLQEICQPSIEQVIQQSRAWIPRCQNSCRVI